MPATDDSSTEPDGTVGTDDGSVPDATVGANDGMAPTDSGMTTTEAGGPDAGDGGTTEGGTVDAGMGDAGNGSSCTGNGQCVTGHCVSGICCATGCTAPGTCQSTSGATCTDGATCVYTTAADNTACNDNNACTTGEKCASGQCVGGTVASCDDGNPCTDDTCDSVIGCKNANNTATCDDGNACTTGDTCSGGLCHGTAMDCSGTAYNDACNVGVCSGGACGKSPKSDGTACDDSNTCTTTDVCAAGTCTGSGNSCGANSTGCTNGNPPTCSCAGGFVNSSGSCVAAASGCGANPCVAGATCSDPSNASGAFVCTCPAGFSGDGTPAPGTGCTQNDNCVGNPCGAGLGTCVNGVNTYTCNCNAGYAAVGGRCVCDMNGTFATQISLTTSWPAISELGTPVFAAATNVPTKEWAIRQQTYDSTGQLVIKTTQCGGTTADLCGVLPSLGINGAYAEYLPATIYDMMGMPVQTLTISLPNALPTLAYSEPQSATLLGISLTDPLGAWPASNANVGANASSGQTNGAAWVDNDGDFINGVTSYSVPPGGILHTVSPNPPIQDYAATSPECTAPNNAYAYLLNVKRLYSASRTVSSMTGTISSCDSITGTLGGPDNGQPRAEARVYGCVAVSGSGEANCSASTVNNLDGQSQTQHITGGSFIIKRVLSTATCEDVRAMTF